MSTEPTPTMLSPVSQHAARFIVKTEMAERVTGRVQGAQMNLRFTFERDHVVVFNQTIDRHVFSASAVCACAATGTLPPR